MPSSSKAFKSPSCVQDFKGNPTQGPKHLREHKTWGRILIVSFFQLYYNFPNRSLILQHMCFSHNAVYSTTDGYEVTWSAWIPMVLNMYRFWVYVAERWAVFSWNNASLKDDLILFVCNTEYLYLPEFQDYRLKFDYLNWPLMTEIRKAVPKRKSF